jgi:hypothetical protein
LVKGISHQDISDILFEKFGVVRSKGSVIGRFHRLGLAKPKVKQKKPEPTLKPEPPKKPAIKSAPVFADGAVFAGEGKPFSERACRWPLSVVNGTQTYCGCTLHRKSYCEHHYGIAYRAA